MDACDTDPTEILAASDSSGARMLRMKGTREFVPYAGERKGDGVDRGGIVRARLVRSDVQVLGSR